MGPNNEVLSNEINNIKDKIDNLKKDFKEEIGKVNVDTKEIKEKLYDNSEKFLEYFKELEKKYVSKEVYRAEKKLLYLIGSFVMIIIGPVVSNLISHFFK